MVDEMEVVTHVGRKPLQPDWISPLAFRLAMVLRLPVSIAVRGRALFGLTCQVPAPTLSFDEWKKVVWAIFLSTWGRTWERLPGLSGSAFAARGFLADLRLLFWPLPLKDMLRA